MLFTLRTTLERSRGASSCVYVNVSWSRSHPFPPPVVMDVDSAVTSTLDGRNQPPDDARDTTKIRESIRVIGVIIAVMLISGRRREILIGGNRNPLSDRYEYLGIVIDI